MELKNASIGPVLCPVEWDYADGYDSVSDRMPKSDSAIGDAVEMELYPYGCAKLRMTEMPLIRKNLQA